MLTAMRRKFAAEDLDGAVAIARIAAPYLHPRVPPAALAPDFASLSDADLDALDAPE
jgi:hypothetical protein